MGGSSTYIAKCDSNLEAFNLSKKILETCAKDYDEMKVTLKSNNKNNLKFYRKYIKKLNYLKLEGIISFENWKELSKKFVLQELGKIVISPSTKEINIFRWILSPTKEGYSIVLEFPPDCNIRTELKKIIELLIKYNIINAENEDIENILDTCVVGDNSIVKGFEKNDFRIKPFIFRYQSNVATGYGINQKPLGKSVFEVFEEFNKLPELKSIHYKIHIESDFDKAIEIMDLELYDDISFYLQFNTDSEGTNELIRKKDHNAEIELIWNHPNWIKSEGSSVYSHISIDLLKESLIISINYHRDVETVLTDIEKVTSKKFTYCDELSG